MSARTVKGILKGLALAAAFVLPAIAATSSGPAPAFKLSARGGKSVDLAQFKGQVVMINFWASWCVPCRQEMPLLEEIYKKYKPMGFTMLGVNVEPKQQDAEAFLAKLSKPVTFPVAWDVDSKVSKLYKVAGMPTTVFIDRKGNVREIHKSYKSGDENYYLTQIRSLLKE